MSVRRFNLLDIERFKQHIDGTTPLAGTLLDGADDYGVSKLIVPEIKGVNAKDLTVDFIISDGQVDRDRDVIVPKGWDLKQYKKNPVVLWAHMSWEPPIAQATSIGVEDDRLVATAKFTPQDLNPFGFMIFRMFAEKYMRATSVGFKPLKWERVEDDEERRGGYNFTKQELLEFSAVPIPANPRALMRAHETGIDLAPLTDFCVRFLDLDPKTVKCVAKQEIEGVWQKLASHPTIVEVKGYELEPEPEPEPTPAPAPEPKGGVVVETESDTVVNLKLTPEEEVLVRALASSLALEGDAQKTLESLMGKLLDACVTKMGPADLAFRAKLVARAGGVAALVESPPDEKEPTDEELEGIEFEEEKGDDGDEFDDLDLGEKDGDDVEDLLDEDDLDGLADAGVDVVRALIAEATAKLRRG